MDFAFILKFLSGLAKHNDRDWFEKNKPVYLEARGMFEQYVARQLDEILKFDSSLNGLDPKKLVFRIYRDVRFSKDKRPYKTNFGASFSAAGKGVGKPGYYLQVEPGNSFLAGGLYMPSPEDLARVRQEIDYNGDKLKKIIKGKKFADLFGDFWDEDKLKTAPKGYPKDHTYIEWLKLKSFIVIRNLKDTEVKDQKLLRNTTDAFKAIKPLHDFMNEAIS